MVYLVNGQRLTRVNHAPTQRRNHSGDHSARISYTKEPMPLTLQSSIEYRYTYIWLIQKQIIWIMGQPKAYLGYKLGPFNKGLNTILYMYLPTLQCAQTSQKNCPPKKKKSLIYLSHNNIILIKDTFIHTSYLWKEILHLRKLQQYICIANVRIVCVSVCLASCLYSK